MGRTVILPSGAELVVNVAPFKDAKNLFQTLAKEWKGAHPGDMATADGMLGLFMSAFSSAEVEKALWPCLVRSLYNGVKITPDLFEPDEARQDYIPACLDVVSDNITPFTKGLFSGLGTQSQTTAANP